MARGAEARRADAEQAREAKAAALRGGAEALGCALAPVEGVPPRVELAGGAGGGDGGGRGGGEQHANV